MAQRGIREYDAKILWSQHSGQPYSGWIVSNPQELGSLIRQLQESDYDLFVVKPDQLFGKRGKHGLIGLKLDAEWVHHWIADRMGKATSVNGISWILTTFLIEPYVAHTQEYYLSFETQRDADIINFSPRWGVDVEENRESVSSLRIGVLDTITDEQLQQLLWQWDIDQDGDRGIIVELIARLFRFFRSNGFVYVECNPFTIVDGKSILLDMVAKVDDCAQIRMWGAWGYIHRIKPFGTNIDPVEAIVQDMDEKSAASLKLHILNPDGRIWMILGGWGASVILIDSLWEMGLSDDIANYGELSGNPDTDSNREYSRLVIKQMLASKAQNKYLLIAGGIANFTYIDSLFIGVCDAITDCAAVIKQQDIRLLVRRWWLNDTKGLAMVDRVCKEHGISVTTADGDIYMTDILRNIR